MGDEIPLTDDMTPVARKLAIGENATPSPFWPWLATMLARLVGRVLWGVRVSGREHVPMQGPLIVAVTHESVLDPVVISGAMPRRMRFLARSSLFGPEGEYSAWGRFLLKLGAVPIERDGGGARHVIKLARKLLKRGDAVLIFPEGTRSQDGEVQRFRRGVGLIARGAKCPVLPISVDGSRRAWPRGRKFPRFFTGPAHVRIGPAITFDKTTSAEDVAARVRAAVLDLRGPDAVDGCPEQSGPRTETPAGDGAGSDAAPGGSPSQGGTAGNETQD